MNETDDEDSTCCAGVSAGAVDVLVLGGQGRLPRAESWRERWDLERCLRQREQQAGRLRDIKVSAVFSRGQYVIWPGGSPGCGKVMRACLEGRLGARGCEGLCSGVCVLW